MLQFPSTELPRHKPLLPSKIDKNRILPGRKGNKNVMVVRIELTQISQARLIRLTFASYHHVIIPFIFN